MNKLPFSYKKYFWDCNFNSLDINTHREFILKRLLSLGNIEAIKYILKVFTQHEIEVFISQKGKGVLTRTNYLFWEKIARHEELWR